MLLRPRKPARGPLGRFFGGFNWGFGKLKNGYVDVSHFLIRKAVIGMAILACFFILDIGVGRKLPTSFLPDEDYGFLFMNEQLPPAASLERTDAVLGRSKPSWPRHPAWRITRRRWIQSLDPRLHTEQRLLFRHLKPWSERTSPTCSPVRSWRTSIGISAQIPEAVAFAFNPPAIPGLGNAGGFSFWLQDRSGGPVEDLDENLQKFLQAARKRPELAGVNSQFSAQTPQIYATVDRDKTLKQGVALAMCIRRCKLRWADST
jgi:HAE1 family hydrophobic/amphiphilic exporter-1